MCDSTFAFGQRGGYFFQCPSKRAYSRLPNKLQTLLSSRQVSQIYHIALGFENSFLITYRDAQGKDRIESQDLLKELNDFLYAKTRNIRALRLSLGSYNESFFVHDQANCLWMNLPAELLVALQARIKVGRWIDRPKIVALGANQNFVLVTERNVVIRDLRNYRQLSAWLDGAGELANVVLNPSRYEGFVVVTKDGGMTHGSLPEHSIQDIEGMRREILIDSKLAIASGKIKEVKRKVAAAEDRLQKPSLQHSTSSSASSARSATILRRGWTERKNEITAQASSRGLKLSLSLNISAAGIAGMLGNRGE
ncbi:hypothetical protein BCR34DRAFT_565470 [Clohesyomyces aquaticus]|uniref:Uncharacterized protein n=1 Tax=Clohesyomyces aquaticus TaxID=1231657 RepID=A0A1Y1ZM61_9PLEO|nr:hypothetical protein BCR34DRAFT_565470 [Clohesyomyces aquaticus]